MRHFVFLIRHTRKTFDKTIQASKLPTKKKGSISASLSGYSNLFNVIVSQT